MKIKQVCYDYLIEARYSVLTGTTAIREWTSGDENGIEDAEELPIDSDSDID